MVASQLALLFIVLASPTVVFGKAGYTYDINDEEAGPLFWGNVPIPDNQCNGAGQSPIEITSSRCTLTQNYKFTVSTKNPYENAHKIVVCSLLNNRCVSFVRTLAFHSTETVTSPSRFSTMA